MLLEGEDYTRFHSIRSKLVANIGSHEILIRRLGEVVNVLEDEQTIIDNELEKGATLNMDAKETLQSLDDVITQLAKQNITTKVTESEILNNEKIKREIKNLKLETEYKQVQLETLKNLADSKKYCVHLPKIALPEFTGKITEWPTFWDSFNSTINTNNDLSRIDKFKYLISCLHGEAKDTLTGFNISNSQYEVAVNLLKERYDDKEFIIHSYYEALSNLQKSKNSTQQLRCTFNFIETQLRSLESLGESIQNNHLVAIIKSKLPAELNLKLEEIREGDWTVNILRKTINKLIVAREKM